MEYFLVDMEKLSLWLKLAVLQNQERALSGDWASSWVWVKTHSICIASYSGELLFLPDCRLQTPNLCSGSTLHPCVHVFVGPYFFVCHFTYSVQACLCVHCMLKVLLNVHTCIRWKRGTVSLEHLIGSHFSNHAHILLQASNRWQDWVLWSI